MSTDSSIEVRDVPTRHRFEAVDPASDEVLGFLTYQRDGDRVVLVHTEVDDAAEGRGVGSTLARTALDSVRDDGLRAVAQCPFVTAYVQRHQEYDDLLVRP